MSSQVNLKKQAIIAEWKKDINKRLVRSGVLLVRDGTVLVSRVPNADLFVGTSGKKRNALIAFNRAQRIAGTIPRSKPFEPPFKQTGFLRANIDYDLDRQNCILVFGVKQAVKYARRLEFGDPATKQLPRPFIRPTVRRNWQKIKTILTATK